MEAGVDVLVEQEGCDVGTGDAGADAVAAEVAGANGAGADAVGGAGEARARPAPAWLGVPQELAESGPAGSPGPSLHALLHPTAWKRVLLRNSGTVH